MAILSLAGTAKYRAGASPAGTKPLPGHVFHFGMVAEREPSLVRDIVHSGHEVGCHSHLHRRVHTLSPAEFREDVRRARGAIEDAAGVTVAGFRAPTFSITRQSLWALEILAELGFTYDSSIFPVRHDLYGIPDAPRGIHQCQLASGQSIWEFPSSTVRARTATFVLTALTT